MHISNTEIYYKSSSLAKNMLTKVNVQEKFALFNDYWSPKIAGELNESYIKLVKLKGEFVWHQHEQEDELFLILKGTLLIKFRDQDIFLQEGEFIVIPKGVEHKPVAEDECQVMLIEPKTTINTGEVSDQKTLTQLDHI